MGIVDLPWTNPIYPTFEQSIGRGKSVTFPVDDGLNCV